MSTNSDDHKLHFLLLLLCLHLSVIFGFMCPNTDESYHNDYDEFLSFNSQTRDTKFPKYRPFGINFDSGKSSFEKEFLRETKKIKNRRRNIFLNNETSKSTGAGSKKVVNVVLNSYQSNFDLMYSRESNYSQIFEDPTADKLLSFLPTRSSENYVFSSFPSLREIYEYLGVLEKLGNGRAKTFPLKFHNGSWNVVHTNFRNEILSIRISPRTLDEFQVENPIIVVVAGIHGRDWYAIRSAIFLATELINHWNRTRKEDFDWWIIPVLNPDGYEISQMHERWRNWEKNLHGAKDFKNIECFGLDLDLNFEYQYLDCAASPCDFNFPGNVPFLAPEAQGLRDTLEAFSDYLEAFVALKEGKQMLVYPFSDTFQSPRNVDSFEKISKKGVKAFKKHVEEFYEYGQSSCLLNISAGFIEDWAKVHLGVDKSFAFYLGPTSKDRRDLKSQHLMAHMRGTFDLINVIARGKIRKVRNSAATMYFSLIYFSIILII